MADREYEVVMGPTKFDLLFALGAAKFPNEKKVLFQIPTSSKKRRVAIKVTVMSVQAVDITGENWNIEGTVAEICRANDAPADLSEITDDCRRVFVRYVTDERNGFLRIIN